MTELPNGRLTSENGMSPSWRGLALKLREQLKGLDIAVTQCLAGEPDFCGADYAHHAISYAAAIKAYGEETLKHLHHGDPGIERAVDALVDHWGKLFASQGEHCDHCEKPPVPEPDATGRKATGS